MHSQEFIKTEFRILEALKYRLNFFDVSHFVNYLTAAVLQKYGVHANADSIFKKLKNVFCTDFYFTENPVVLCVHFVWEEISQWVLWDNFIKLFDEAVSTQVENKVREFKKKLETLESFSDEEMSEAMKKLEQLNQFVARIKNRGSVAVTLGE